MFPTPAAVAFNFQNPGFIPDDPMTLPIGMLGYFDFSRRPSLKLRLCSRSSTARGLLVSPM
jgi:hypothetical protein